MAKSAFLVNYPDLGEKVYEVVRDQIVTCELQPGSPLPVVELSRQLGVSLTPVRDALNRLAAEGLVEDVARKGYFVARLDPNGIRDLLGARRLLEAAAAEEGVRLIRPEELAEMRRLADEMAALLDETGCYTEYAEFSKRDSQFHQVIVGTAKNSHLLDIYRRLSVHLHIYRTNLAVRSGPRTGFSDFRYHHAIVEGFEKRDLAAIKAAIREHVAEVADSLAGDGEGQG